ncbi:MAG: DUF2510 domain-containing protein [Acidobacteria bacterium]|nr:DUF2510 domain-containing protein [Acidobacteriota bacterium]
MTDAPAAIPAGWYPDAATAGVLRWWDGAAWTAHTAPAGGSPERPLLPADRPIYSPFIWVIALLPLASAFALAAWTPDVSSIGAGVYGTGQITVPSIYTPGYFVILGLGWVVYGLGVLFAFRDWLWLKRQGVVRPFHWAWSFLGAATVYVIGRSVIVRRVAAPRGLAPIWVSLGVVIASVIVTVVWVVNLTVSILDQLRPSIGA